MGLTGWFNNNKKSRKDVIGIEVRPEEICFAHLQATTHPEIVHCEKISNPDSQQALEQFKDSISSLNLRRASCNAVLAPEDYTVLLVESPNVPNDELRDAVKWKVRDLSPTPIDQAVIDVFEMPEDSGNVGKGMIFTVIARKQAIEKLVNITEAAELSLSSIDIPELCLRDIVIHNAVNSRSIVLVRLHGETASITAICNGNIYLSRSFSFHYQDGVIHDQQAESLTLEVQRSVDYFHHQMRQPTPSRIFLLGNGLQDSDLPASLTESFPAKVSALDISLRVPVSASIDKRVTNACSLAIGAALRDVAASKWEAS